MTDVTAEQNEIEQLRVQLAGCGVIAGCNTQETLERHMPDRSSFGFSESLQSVRSAVQREIAYREALEKILPKAPLEVLTTLLEQLSAGSCGDQPIIRQLEEAIFEAEVNKEEDDRLQDETGQVLN